MKNFFKGTYALFVAVTAIAMCPLSVEASDLKTEDGVKYIQYDNGETKLYTGWTKKAGKRYYYKNGIMKKSCWLKSNGKRTYFLRKDGSMAVGKITISGVEYEFDENGKLIPDTWGITLSASDVTPTGMSVAYLWNDTWKTGKLEYGDAFTIECYAGGKWEKVPYVCDEVPEFTELAYELAANETVTKKRGWKDIYGELPSGKYRLCTDIIDCRNPGDCDIKTYYAYFTI